MSEDLTSITILGDIAFNNKTFMNSPFHFKVDQFGKIIDSDIVIGNLEFPFSKERKRNFESSYFNYIAPDKAIDVIRDLNISIMSLANNHIMDWGSEGFEYTVRMLNENNIITLGAGKNENEAREGKIFTFRETKFGILSYCKDGKWIATENSSGAAVLDLNKIKEDVEILKYKVDHILVSLHWGVEFSSYPSPTDRKIAHDIIDMGVEIIVGHHPHVVQGLEIYNGKPIFYSLGSFIYDTYGERIFVENKIEERLLSIAVRVYFDKKKIIKWEIIPYKNKKDSLYPVEIAKTQRDAFDKYFDIISDRIKECEKWFYAEAYKNLSSREIKTVIRHIIDSKGLYLIKLLSIIKPKHIVMLFKSIIYQHKKL